MDITDLTQRVIAFADDQNVGGDPFLCDIKGLSLVRQRTPTPFAPVLYMPLACLVLQGTKQASLGARKITFGAMQSLIVSMDLPTKSRVIEASNDVPYVALALELDLGLLRELALLIGPRGAQADAGEVVAGEVVAAGPSDAALLDAMGRLFGLVGKPDAAAIVAPLIKREIHYLLLQAQHGAMLRQLMNQDAHASRIALSIALIKRDYNRPLRVPDLARVAGMSVSGFHDHFKVVTATTPLQFQKQLRLMTARQMLAVSNCASVTDTALHVGYESPTQFSRDYARAFGMPPSQMMRAGR